MGHLPGGRVQPRDRPDQDLRGYAEHTDVDRADADRGGGEDCLVQPPERVLPPQTRVHVDGVSAAGVSLTLALKPGRRPLEGDVVRVRHGRGGPQSRDKPAQEQTAAVLAVDGGAGRRAFTSPDEPVEGSPPPPALRGRTGPRGAYGHMD